VLQTYWPVPNPGWSKPAATNAPVQDEAGQAVLGMNPNTSSPPSPGIFIFLFSAQRVLSALLSAPKFSPPTYPPYPEPSPTLNLNLFSPLNSKRPWSARVVE